ncbi:MAG: NAD(P)/FAD-dependent oxidoreductase [Paracoccus sp. (in: a-proteobacteria)]|nr:NAD(P)/FAD-dependent oxidoreductase [Paracoccus sp. (in: a-proteobacteria)]
MRLSRRGFIATTIATGSVLAAPAVLGQGRPQVVVIGGGAGGATAARYLMRDSDGALDVTLIEANPIYTTCFFSNLYLGGVRDFESLQHGYDGLSAAGIQIIHDLATGVDRDARMVTLAGGQTLPYDRLILSPGIDFVEGSVPGWSVADAEVMPHAYKAGPQTRLLRDQVQDMRQGGTFAMIAPPNPYRCPPGPYERISMIAHLLRQSNPTAKILLIDPKENYSKQTLFENGWLRYYDGMIERIGPDFGGDRAEVRPASMEVVIDGQVEAVDVCNVIPGQAAGAIAQMAGVTDDSGWAPVHPEDMRSRIDQNVFVLGDSALQGDMPKSAFSANSQAKVAAMMVRADLLDARAFPARYANTCWSLIAPEDGVKVGATYEPTPEKIATVEGFISQPDEDDATRAATYAESVGWYDGIIADMLS